MVPSRTLASQRFHNRSNAWRIPEARRGWFISRGNGILVPLVAVDELPLGINLVGVPRYLSLSSAGRMNYVGEYASTGVLYELSPSPAFVRQTTTPQSRQVPSECMGYASLQRHWRPSSTSAPSTLRAHAPHEAVDMSKHDRMQAAFAEPVRITVSRKPEVSHCAYFRARAQYQLTGWASG